MIHTGETIENPITGERITFLATSADTDGEAVVIETVVEPHGFVATAHVHPTHFDVVRLPFPPAFVQRLGLALGAPVGRLLGYTPTYIRTAEPLAANA